MFTDFSHIEIIESPKLRFHRRKSKNNETRVKPSNKLLLHMSSLGEDITLKLKRNPSLMTALPSDVVSNPFCFYHGQSLSHADSIAAISICDGVVSEYF